MEIRRLGAGNLVRFFLPRRRISWALEEASGLLHAGGSVEHAPRESIDDLVLFLRNDGRETVRAEDFDGPLCLDFGRGSRVTSAALIETNPDRFGSVDGVVLVERRSMLEVEPFLMNKGDCIVFSVRVENFEGTVVPRVGLTGEPCVVRRIKPRNSLPGRDFAARGFAIGVFIVAALSLATATLSRLGLPQVVLTSTGRLATISTDLVGGFRLACLVAGVVCLGFWADLSSPRRFLNAESVWASRVAGWVLLLAGVLVGFGSSRIIYEALVVRSLSPFLGF